MASRLLVRCFGPRARVLAGRAALCGGAVGVAGCGIKRTMLQPARCDGQGSMHSAGDHVVHAPAEAASTQPSLMVRCLAEAIGTAIIVQGGCGAVCAMKYAGASFSTFGIAAVWGVSVMLAAYSTRAVSGAHLNPAVTVALVSTGSFPAQDAPACMRQRAEASNLSASSLLCSRMHTSANTSRQLVVAHACVRRDCAARRCHRRWRD